jgi:hypothetical protein
MLVWCVEYSCFCTSEPACRQAGDTRMLNNAVAARYKKINKLINDFQIRGVCRKCDSFISSIVFL